MVRVLVAGGTGTVGRAVIAEALARGFAVRSISRQIPPPGDAAHITGIDYRACDLYRSTPADLDAALDGIDVVVDCLNGVSHVAQAIFQIGSNQIADAAERSTVSRIVVASDVGCDRSDFAYYEAKSDQEGVYLDCDVDTTVVRFTVVFEQLDELATRGARWWIMPTSSRAKLQPIDVRDVASVLVDACADTGADRITSVGGPQICSIRELTRMWLRSRGRRALLAPVPLVTALGRYLRTESNLVPNARVGSRTFAAWLADHPVVDGARRPHRRGASQAPTAAA